MSFKEQVADLAMRASAAQSLAQTEEATKNAVIMPFLKVLGFDVFDPQQIIPEYTADVGIKKGEKVDYAAVINGKIEILIEAKGISTNLNSAQYNQLFRYFTVSEAHIAILTNGMQFWFFTDVDQPNKMDQLPFFKFDLGNYDDLDIRELEKFHKTNFSVDNLKSAASALKYTTAAISFLESQLSNPSDEFVRLVIKSFYEKNITKVVLEDMRPTVKRAFDELFRTKMRQKLAAAFDSATVNEKDNHVLAGIAETDELITTEDEIIGYQIIKAIAIEHCDVERIFIRDAKSYCAIIYDNNNRKPIARMHFNGKKKYISIFDADKSESRHEIDSMNDIYKFKSDIARIIKHYNTVDA